MLVNATESVKRNQVQGTCSSTLVFSARLKSWRALACTVGATKSMAGYLLPDWRYQRS